MARVFITFDFELGWGAIETNRWRVLEHMGVYNRLWAIIPKILSEMDRLEIPASWATIGAMIDPPSPDQFSHLPDFIQQKFRAFLKKAQQRTKDGRSLFEAILTAKIHHEIASHSFSHTRFNLKGYHLNAQIEDLKQSVSIVQKWIGQIPDYFVFPQNIVTSFDAVDANGFKRVRVLYKDICHDNKTPARFKRFFQSPPPVFKQKVTDTLTAYSASMWFNWWEPFYRLRRQYVLLKSRRALQFASKGQGDYHIWLHPYDLALTPDLCNDFIEFLHMVATLRDNGLIKI